MGRPERHDVDYFPFYIKDGRTLFILEDQYGCKGTGFFTNVMRFLSRTPDHHFQIKSKADRLYFFATVKCDEEDGADMLNIMIMTGKLDRELWEQEKVLASIDYLASIKDAYRKRTNNCITIEEIKKLHGVTTGRNTQASGKLPEEIQDNAQVGVVTTGIKPQTKLNYTRLEETKEEEPPLSPLKVMDNLIPELKPLAHPEAIVAMFRKLYKKKHGRKCVMGSLTKTLVSNLLDNNTYEIIISAMDRYFCDYETHDFKIFSNDIGGIYDGSRLNGNSRGGAKSSRYIPAREPGAYKEPRKI